jgi:hypothetical protein
VRPAFRQCRYVKRRLGTHDRDTANANFGGGDPRKILQAMEIILANFQIDGSKQFLGTTPVGHLQNLSIKFPLVTEIPPASFQVDTSKQNGMKTL